MASGSVGGACVALNNAPASVRSAAGARGLPAMNITSPIPTTISHQANPIVEPSGETKVDRAQPPAKKMTAASPAINLRRTATVNATAVDSIAMTQAIDPTTAVAVKGALFQKASTVGLKVVLCSGDRQLTCL